MPWIIAHRGASDDEPENTLRAFRRAIELGADMVELDVHLSRDGHVVVIHDDDVARTTDGTGEVPSLTLGELQRLNAGKGERIPTLQEVIDLVRGRCRLYVELKGEGTPEAVIQILRANRFEAQAILGSFRKSMILEAKARLPMIPTSLLVGPGVEDPVTEAQGAGASYVHLCWERRSNNPAEFLTADLLARIRSRGLGVILWHEERAHVIEAFRGVDVDGVCSNRPELLLALKQSDGTSAWNR